MSEQPAVPDPVGAATGLPPITDEQAAPCSKQRRHVVRIHYAMASSRDEVAARAARHDGAACIETLADTMTDLHGTEYDGPTPQVGQDPLPGVVRAWSPTQAHVGRKQGIVHVWVAAFDADRPSA